MKYVGTLLVHQKAVLLFPRVRQLLVIQIFPSERFLVGLLLP